METFFGKRSLLINIKIKAVVAKISKYKEKGLLLEIIGKLNINVYFRVLH